jgi:colanic acid biosynthesis glycosyl transferase WcaI
MSRAANGPMHIGLVTHHYSPEVGAPQRRWGELVPRFIAAGHRVSVLTPPPHYPGGTAGDLPPQHRPGAVATGEHGETVHRVRFRGHGPDLVSRTVDQAVAATDSVVRGTVRFGRRGGRPDVLVASVPGIPSMGAGVALSRALRVPLVVEMRDAWPDLVVPSGMLSGTTRPGGARRLAASAVHRSITWCQSDAAAVVTTTEAFADVLRGRGMAQVHVVRNGAHLGELPVLPREPVPDRPLRVLYLGTVGRSQGLETAVRAVGLLRDRGERVTLRIVGPGVDHARLRAVAGTYGDAVEVVGAVPPSQVLDHYRWADSLLVSLRAWEPFRWTVPSKLYEVLATGRHVTAAVDGEAADLVRSTGGGDVVPPEDPAALADLWGALARDRRRLDVGSGGRQWVLQHSDFDRLAARYLGILEGVVAR